MRWFTFDVETAPLPEDEIVSLRPEWDASSVKLGNLKDEAKIEQKLEESKRRHEQEFVEKAALSPLTGRVLLIGLYAIETARFELIEDPLEHKILAEWWELVERVKRGSHRLAGVNIVGFDLPFLVRRSWQIGVTVPDWVIEIGATYPRWHPTFFDLRLAWQLGDRQAESSFDYIGRCMNTGGKSSGNFGSTFHQLWLGDRETALAYLKNDCVQPAEWLKRMNIM